MDCGSDHRAVLASVDLPTRLDTRPRRRQAPRWVGAEDFHCRFDGQIQSENPDTIDALQSVACQAATRHGAVAIGCRPQAKPWDTAELADLRASRRACRDHVQRRELSKIIFRKTRAALRTWQTEKARGQLEKFVRLGMLERFAREPVLRKSATQPSAEQFANLWKETYMSSHHLPEVGNLELLTDIPSIESLELKVALRQLRKGRCADKHSVFWCVFCLGPWRS